MSDLYRLHSLSRVGAAGKKLAFYVVALRQMGRAEWLKLEREVQGEIGRLERESGEGEGDAEAERERSQLLL